MGKGKEEEEGESSEEDGAGVVEVKEEQADENLGGLAARGDEVNDLIMMANNHKCNAMQFFKYWSIISSLWKAGGSN